MRKQTLLLVFLWQKYTSPNIGLSDWDGPASKATGHAPRPERNWPVPLSASAQASSRLRRPACVTRGDLLVVGNFAPFAPFSEFFFILRVEHFQMVLSVHVYLWSLWMMKSFMEIGPRVFEKSGRQTHTQTDAAALYIYIHTYIHTYIHIRLIRVVKLNHLKCSLHSVSINIYTNIRIMKSVSFRNLVLLIIVMLWGRVRIGYGILVWSGR